MRFAESTSVSVDKSRAEIERLIKRYGATATAFMSEDGRAIIAFQAQERRVKFELPFPTKTDEAITHYRHSRGSMIPRTKETVEKVWEQACRQAWRTLALVIKAKLEAVASGITTFESEFLAHIVMPDGRTVGDHTKATIANAYLTGKMQPLLPPPGKHQ